MRHIGILFVSTGLFIFLSATIGFLRFPDFYTRMHATGKGDTGGLLFLMVGLAFLYLSENLGLRGLFQAVKMLSIVVFWFLATPTATHMLMRSAFESNVRPWTRTGRTIRERDDMGA